MVHDTRVIPIDSSTALGAGSRPHISSKIRQYLGDARGRWEGTTLVVETTNFNDKAPYRGSSDQLRIVERFTPIGPDTLEWAITFDDPHTWARPWTFAMNLTHDESQPPFEYACHEGNYGLRNILSAARAEERMRAASSTALAVDANSQRPTSNSQTFPRGQLWELGIGSLNGPLMPRSGSVQERAQTILNSSEMRVLIVDDEPALSAHLAKSLGEAGYAVDVAADGEQADFAVRTESYDAVLLDLGLPRIDGLTVLRNWRQSGVGVPVLVLTARGSWHETVDGIDAGADDYVAKPFRIEEVLARLRGLIRRASGHAQQQLHCGDVTLDPRLVRVTKDGVPVRLTSHEFRVLSYLMHHRDRVVSQGELTEHIYAQDFDRDSNTVEVFVARLRRKLGASLIQTVRGLGYRLGS
jgi:two-component system OmpR family response regulator